MNSKHIKATLASVAAASSFMALGWSFFDMIVRCDKKEKKKKRREWFMLSHTKVNHPRDKFENEYEEGKAWCAKQSMQDCYVKSRDGLRLHALFLPAQQAERIVILSHGYRGTSFGDFAYTARFLHEHGCSLLFVDQRCCGKSEGEYITFGAKEKYDIQKWAYYTASRTKNNLPVYLYGESMGAAAVLMASGLRLPRQVKGIISDCGFTSMKAQLKTMADDWFHLKWIGLLLFRVDIFCRLFAGFAMKEADATKALQTGKRPVLFFHGAKDTYVNPKNSRHNYELCSAPKELVIMPEARHICSPYTEPDRYRDKLMDFFEKNEASPAS